MTPTLSFPLNQKLITRTSNRPNVPLIGGKARGICFHETDNWSVGADAYAHARYFFNGSGGRQASVHFAVDDHEAWQSLSLTEQGWWAGDGAGGGDTIHLAIELCVNVDGDFDRTMENGAELAGFLQATGKVATYELYQHYDFSKKNCPRFIRAGGHWPKLAARVAYHRNRFLKQENEMSPEEKKLLNDLADVVLRNGIEAEVTPNTKHLFPAGAPLEKVYWLKGSNALAYAKIRGFSFALGLRRAQNSITQLGNRAEGLAMTLTNHKHTGDGAVDSLTKKRLEVVSRALDPATEEASINAMLGVS